MERKWMLYILRCKDETLYTGITDNLSRRLAAHRSGKGAKYTKGRAPLTLCYLQLCENHSEALRLEIQIKRLSRQEKLALISSYSQDLTIWNEIEKAPD